MNTLFSKRAFFAYAFALTALAACDSEEDFPPTGKPGLPSSFEYADGRRFAFAYADGQLVRILDPEGSGTDFHYENGTLSFISFFPPEGMEDGHGSTEFKRITERIIQVRRTGEPMLSAFQEEEIALDDHGYPVRIRDLGAYDYRGTNEGTSLLEPLWKGKTFTLLAFDLSNGNLLKRDVYSLPDSTLLSSQAYEYTSTPGMLSGTHLPRWFTGYWSNRQASQQDLYYRLFFNLSGNLLRETAFDPASGETSSTSYEYRYDKNGFPNWVSSEALPAGARIRY